MFTITPVAGAISPVEDPQYQLQYLPVFPTRLERLEKLAFSHILCVLYFLSSWKGFMASGLSSWPFGQIYNDDSLPNMDANRWGGPPRKFIDVLLFLDNREREREKEPDFLERRQKKSRRKSCIHIHEEVENKTRESVWAIAIRGEVHIQQQPSLILCGRPEAPLGVIEGKKEMGRSLLDIPLYHRHKCRW